MFVIFILLSETVNGLIVAWNGISWVKKNGGCVIIVGGHHFYFLYKQSLSIVCVSTLQESPEHFWKYQLSMLKLRKSSWCVCGHNLCTLCAQWPHSELGGRRCGHCHAGTSPALPGSAQHRGQHLSSEMRPNVTRHNWELAVMTYWVIVLIRGRNGIWRDTE